MSEATNQQSSSSLLLSSLKDLLPEKNTVIIFSNRMKGLLAKSDGKDKTIALLQYLAMFTSNGTPGNAMSLQKSFGSARKPFRIFKEVEFLLPVIENPPVGNHIVFLGATGLVTNKRITELCQKLSYYGWFVGSVAGLYQSANELGKCVRDVAEAEDDEDRKQEIAKVAKPVFTAITTNTLQALLALALLEKIPMKKRNVGALGVVLSMLNVYSMFPPPPPPDAKDKGE
jgi:hypothetical protein